MKKNHENIFLRILRFYYDGFRNMTLGKTLWCLILIKLFVMFFILKLFFFHDFISENSEKGEEAEFVMKSISEGSVSE